MRLASSQWAQTISTKQMCKASDERPPGASSKALGSGVFLQNAVPAAYVLSGGHHAGPAIPSRAGTESFPPPANPVMPSTIQTGSWCSVNVGGGLRMGGAVPGVQSGSPGLHLLLPEHCPRCLDGDEDLSVGQSGAGPGGKVMTTCLRGSFQASPLLVFWEPRCLPTMAWLVRLPGFLAQRAGRIACFRGEQSRDGPAFLPVSPGRARAKRWLPKRVFRRGRGVVFSNLAVL